MCLVKFVDTTYAMPGFRKSLGSYALQQQDPSLTDGLQIIIVFATADAKGWLRKNQRPTPGFMCTETWGKGWKELLKSVSRKMGGAFFPWQPNMSLSCAAIFMYIRGKHVPGGPRREPQQIFLDKVRLRVAMH